MTPEIVGTATGAQFRYGGATIDVTADGEVTITPAPGKRLINGGVSRISRFRRPSDRYELLWLGGERGLPQLNAVASPPAADTYNTASMLAAIKADREFEVLGTNAASADATIYVEGGVKLATHGADGDSTILVPHLTAGLSRWTGVTWGTDKETEWEATILLGTNITNFIAWAGLKLTNTPTTATDDDQVFFRLDDTVNSGKWQAIASIANVDVATDSGIAPAVSTEYHLRITIDSTRVARMYINGTLVYTSGALTSTNLIPYVGVKANGAAAAKFIVVRGQAISRKFA